jgi:hypothetical protein
LETGRARVGNRETGSERQRESADGWSCETEKLYSFLARKRPSYRRLGRGAGLVLARIKKHPLPSDYEVRGFKVMSTSTI